MRQDPVDVSLMSMSASWINSADLFCIVYYINIIQQKIFEDKVTAFKKDATNIF